MASSIAIVILACRDYAAFELAMAAHATFLPKDVPIYILQNCRGTYDAERTLGVAHRYAGLYPRSIKVIADYGPAPPFVNIKRLLSSEEFARFDLICKVDDDAFPIRDGWLDDLLAAWRVEAESGRYAFATPLINNNKWGFTEVMDLMGLREEYFATVAREHVVERGMNGGRIVPASEIEIGAQGTIWGYPYIARWIHKHTSFRPDEYVAATRGLEPVSVTGKKRYSIGCILFRRTDWISLGEGSDDEGLWHMRCEQDDLDILCVRSVPFVHLAYFTQREENRDIVESLKVLYEPRFNLPFPISLYRHATDLEARLRWLEDKLIDRPHHTVSGQRNALLDEDPPAVEKAPTIEQTQKKGLRAGDLFRRATRILRRWVD